MSDLTIVTNNVPRPVLEAHELTLGEQAEFDYVDWAAVERGDESPQFFRYQGELYDLGDGFETVLRYQATGALAGWNGIRPESFFSGLVIRWPRLEWGAGLDFESVIVGRYCC